MKVAELAAVVQDLAARVAALEAPPRSRPPDPGELGLVRSIVAELPMRDDGIAETGTVVCAGAGPTAAGLVAWQMDRRWVELTATDAAPVARLLAALGNPQRVQIVQLLLQAPATTAELTERLEGPSSGQLFHHLKELLAAGLVHQPQRGTYAVRQQHVVPLLTVLCCSLDLGGTPSPDDA